MSVHVSERNLSSTEHIRQFLSFYNFAEKELYELPKRKYRWIGKPVMDIINDIYEDLFSMNNSYFHYGIKEKDNQAQVNEVIHKFRKLNDSLFIMWNVQMNDIEYMDKWASQMENIIDLLLKISCIKRDRARYMNIIDYSVLNRASFLNNMCELHRFIYKKTISINSKLRESKGSELMHLADLALVCLFHANIRVPNTKEEYLERKKNIATAFDCVNNMQLPITSLFFEMHYGEKTMLQWASLVDTQLKLLHGLQKSDEERFGHLLKTET